MIVAKGGGGGRGGGGEDEAGPLLPLRIPGSQKPTLAQSAKKNYCRYAAIAQSLGDKYVPCSAVALCRLRTRGLPAPSVEIAVQNVGSRSNHPRNHCCRYGAVPHWAKIEVLPESSGNADLDGKHPLASLST